jgi:hypothetical protein
VVRNAAPFQVLKDGSIWANKGSLGELAVIGALEISAAGTLQSGATGFLAGTGWWLDYNAGAPRLRVGSIVSGALSKGIAWDGSAVQIRSNYVTLDDVNSEWRIAQWYIDESQLRAQACVLHKLGYGVFGTGNDIVRVDGYDATWRLWIGHATATSAPFRVDKAGNIYANSVKLLQASATRADAIIQVNAAGTNSASNGIDTSASYGVGIWAYSIHSYAIYATNSAGASSPAAYVGNASGVGLYAAGATGIEAWGSVTSLKLLNAPMNANSQNINSVAVLTAATVVGTLRNDNSGTAEPTGGSNGDQYIETDANKLWIKIAGTWRYVALT